MQIRARGGEMLFRHIKFSAGISRRFLRALEKASFSCFTNVKAQEK